MNDGNKLTRIKTDGSNREKLNDDETWYIKVFGGWIYYTNLSAGEKLYRVRTDGSGREEVH